MNWYKKAVKQIIIPAKDYDGLMELVNKIISGKKEDWTQEELQLQQNYPQALEMLIKHRAA
jgi:hypothetical protein